MTVSARYLEREELRRSELFTIIELLVTSLFLLAAFFLLSIMNARISPILVYLPIVHIVWWKVFTRD